MILHKIFGQKISTCQHVRSGDRKIGLMANFFGQLHCTCGEGDHAFDTDFESVSFKSLKLNSNERKLCLSLKNHESAICANRSWIRARRPLSNAVSEDAQRVVDDVHCVIREQSGFWVIGNGDNAGFMTDKNGMGQFPIWLKRPENGGGLNDPIFKNETFFLSLDQYNEKYRVKLIDFFYVIIAYHEGEYPQVFNNFNNCIPITAINFLPDSKTVPPK